MKQTTVSYDVCAALFVMTLIVSNIASVKLVSAGPAVFDAGTILFPLAYILGDVITEVYGFHKMRRLLIIGIGMLILTSLTFWIVGMLPAAADWTNQTAYDSILGVVWRIILASITAIFIGELFNSYVLAKLKIKYAGRYLWGRLIGSSGIGSLLDTTIFSVIAFAGTVSGSVLVQLIATVFAIKMLVEIVVSPITIAVIKRLKKVDDQDSYEQPDLLRYK